LKGYKLCATYSNQNKKTLGKKNFLSGLILGDEIKLIAEGRL
jgi:hypothetical protein